MYLESVVSSTPIQKKSKQEREDTRKKFIEQAAIDTKEPSIKATTKRMTGRWLMVPTGLNRAKIMNIKYAEDSSAKNPIMCDEVGQHRVFINEVDPSKASELEMQMLCAHLDATGQGTGSTFGTYNDLRTVRMAAQYSNGGGLSSMVPSLYDRVHTHYNWIELTETYMNIVKGNDPKQYAYIKRLYDALSNV